MIEAIRSFFNTEIIGELNALIADSTLHLNEVNTTLSDNVSSNLKDRGYYIMLNSVEVEDQESDIQLNADVIVRFSFLIAKKENEGYRRSVDDYMLNVVRKLKSKFSNLQFEENEYTLVDVSEINLSNLGSLTENNYLQPELTFNLIVIASSVFFGVPFTDMDAIVYVERVLNDGGFVELTAQEISDEIKIVKSV